MSFESRKVLICLKFRWLSRRQLSTSFQIILTIFVLCSLHQTTNCTLNRTATRIIPIKPKINLPKTHERIIVPIEPIAKDEQIEKPVTELPVELNVKRRTSLRPQHPNATEAPIRSRQSKRNPKHYDDGKGNYYNAYSYVKRNDEKPQTEKSVVKIQPLHINTKVFNNSRPQKGNSKPPTGKYQSKIRGQNPNHIHELKQNAQDSRHKLKLDKLPENPTEIPATSWFDNIGKYYYGILHDEVYHEPSEYSNNQQSVTASNEKTVEAPPPKMFKSSFRAPGQNQPAGNSLGNFLYKSEILYPSYRHNLYPPVTIYGDYLEHKPSTKELPTLSVQKKPQQSSPPKKHYQQPETKQQHPQQETKKPSQPVETKQAPAEDDEDYEEESSEDGDEGADNDRYDGDPPSDYEDDGGSEGEEEDEGESTEKSDAPSYRYAYDGGSSRSDENDDQFEKAWSKYGYGRGNNAHSGSGEDDSGSYESSETKALPQRIKFYHEKMEQITTPMKPTTETPVLFKQMNKVMSGSLNNSKPKNLQPPPIIKSPQPLPSDTTPQPPPSVKSPADEKEISQRSNGAASDDLKYFQWV